MRKGENVEFHKIPYFFFDFQFQMPTNMKTPKMTKSNRKKYHQVPF